MGKSMDRKNISTKKEYTMELNEKLRSLRNQKGLTQEELANALYVSRTAISKWESGRGYPSIDSLKTISEFFGITLDELLSVDKVLTLAKEDTKQKETAFINTLFALLDISVLMLLFLPLFGQKSGGEVIAVSLLAFEKITPILKIAYYITIAAIPIFGITTLILQSFTDIPPVKNKISLLLSLSVLILFIISSQPYVAILMLAFTVIKAILLVKKR